MCNINYTSLVFDETSQTVTLKGTADCNSITASIDSPNFTIAKTTGVDVNGEWTIVYSGSDLILGPIPIKDWCNMSPKINSLCTYDQRCKGPSNFVLQCVSSNSCPEITLELTDISNCNNAGKRTATFEITVTNPTNPTVYEVEFGDGESDSYVFDASENPNIITHEYSEGGTFSAIVNCTYPENCPSSNSVRVVIPPCNNDNCPFNIDFEIIDSAGNRFRVINNNGIFEAVANNPTNTQINCLPSGRYTLRVTLPSGADLSFVWREDENIPIENNSRDFAFSLTNAEEKIINVVVKRDGCTDLPESVSIRECNSNGNGDNSPVNCEFTEDRGRCISGQLTITRTIITPARNGGRPCPPLRETRNCTSPPPICDFCCIWNWINIILFIATSVFILITFCMLEATAVSAIIALASGGTLAAVTAALSTANIVMLWISLGLMVSGLISLILWLIFCVFNKPNACDLLSTLMIALSAITASSFVLSIILFIAQRLGCTAGALIDLGWFSLLLSIATLVFTALGCFNRNSN